MTEAFVGARFIANSPNAIDCNPGFTIYGIVVDNPCGTWLLLEPLHLYVPPYTIGWRYSPMPGVRNLSLEYTSGPSQFGIMGQPVSAQKEPTILQVYASSVGWSPGITYIDMAPPLNVTVASTTLNLGIGAASGFLTITPFLGASASTTARYRIWRLDVLAFGSAITVASLGTWHFFAIGSSSWGNRLFVRGACTTSKPSEHFTYTQGFDTMIGETIQFAIGRTDTTAVGNLSVVTHYHAI